MIFQPATPSPPQIENAKLAARRAAARLALRWAASAVCLWGLCTDAACRRAQECRGDPHRCMRRALPLLPEEVREGLRAMADGHERRLSFDALREEYPEEIDAVCDWAGRVLASARPPR